MENDDKDIVAAYLREILAGLVEHTEEIEVGVTEDEQGTLFTVKVHSEEWGRIIGKAGKTAKAIRDIIRIKGSMNGMKAAVKIDAPEFQKREETEPQV